MLECSLKNANISARYFGMGPLLALRSCLPQPCLPGGMGLGATAARGVFLHFAAANSIFIFAWRFGGSRSGRWNRRMAFRAFSFRCRGIVRAKDVAEVPFPTNGKGHEEAVH